MTFILILFKKIFAEYNNLSDVKETSDKGINNKKRQSKYQFKSDMFGYINLTCYTT